MVNWTTGSYHGGSAPIQFDSSGAIYYSGYSTTGQTVLRRFDGSTIRNLITDNVMLNSFAVAPNGTVVITGSTTSTNASWTRRISPSGTLASLENGGVSFTSVFPDGNVYMGMYSPGVTGVARYLATSDQMDPKPWIADSTSAGSATAYFDVDSVCSPTASPSGLLRARWGFDQSGSMARPTGTSTS